MVVKQVKQDRVTLKSVKIAKYLSQETTAFTASLYFDGKRIGTVRNNGCGGCCEVMVMDRKVRDEFFSFCRDLPPFEGLPMDEDFLIGLILEDYQVNEWLKRQHKKGLVCFRLRSDKPGVWTAIHESPGWKAYLEKTYGEEIEHIAPPQKT